MPLIDCEANLILPWSSAFVITNSTSAGRFPIRHTKLTICSSSNFINSR